MATVRDIRRVAASLPGVEASSSDLAFSVTSGGKTKGIAWSWKERIDPKKARVPNLGVLAVRVENVAQRDLMIAAEPEKFFTEPHYNGYPAVLVRLAEVTAAELEVLLAEAVRCQTARPASRARRRSR